MAFLDANSDSCRGKNVNRKIRRIFAAVAESRHERAEEAYPSDTRASAGTRTDLLSKNTATKRNSHSPSPVAT